MLWWLRVKNRIGMQPVEGLPLGLRLFRVEDSAELAISQHLVGVLVFGSQKDSKLLMPNGFAVGAEFS